MELFELFEYYLAINSKFLAYWIHPDTLRPINIHYYYLVLIIIIIIFEKKDKKLLFNIYFANGQNSKTTISKQTEKWVKLSSVIIMEYHGPSICIMHNHLQCPRLISNEQNQSHLEYFIFEFGSKFFVPNP